jgi:branched-chain amino acid transport system substrate-binding protein
MIMRIAVIALCCLAILAPAAGRAAGQGTDGGPKSALVEMRALAAKGDFKGVRRSGKSLLAAYPGAEGSVEARLLLGAADDKLGFYDEAKAALAPVVANGGSGTQACEAYLLIAEAERSKGAYGAAAASVLSALSLHPDDSQRGRGRAMLMELGELLSKEERLSLKAKFASVQGIEIVAGTPPAAKAAVDSAAGRKMAADVPQAPPPARSEKPASPVKTFPVAIVSRPPRGATLRIGVLCPLEGRFAPLGESFVRGAAIAVKEARLKGIKNVELVVGDTRGSPLLCRTVAERLVEGEQVDALMGEVLSSSTIAAAQYAELSKTVLVSPVASEEGIDEIGDWVFQTTLGPGVEIPAMARMACDRLGLRRIGFMSPDDPHSRNTELLFRDEVERLGGELCVAEIYAEGTTDFSESIARIAAADPEALFIASDTEDLILILPQLSFHEFGSQLLGTSEWNSKRLVRMAGKDLEGAIFPAQIEESEGEKRYSAACAAAKEPPGEVNQVVIGGYNGARILIDALSKSKSGGNALRDELARSFEKRQNPLLDLMSGPGFPFNVIRSERVVPFGTLKLHR